MSSYKFSASLLPKDFIMLPRYRNSIIPARAEEMFSRGMRVEAEDMPQHMALPFFHILQFLVAMAKRLVT